MHLTPICLLAAFTPQIPQYSTLSEILVSEAPTSPGAFGLHLSSHGEALAVSDIGAWDPVSVKRGRVWLFEREATGQFVRAGSLISPVPNTMYGDFGFATDFGPETIAVTDLAVVGAVGNGSGVVQMFERVQGQWLHTQALAPPSYTNHESVGWWVALDGDHLLAGSPAAKVGTVFPGAVHHFNRDANGVWVFLEKITPPTPAIQQGMGFGRAFDASGGVLVVGARSADVGPAQDAGAAYVFRRDEASGTYAFVEDFTVSTPVSGARLGWAVAVSDDGGRVAVSAPREGWGGTVYVAEFDPQGALTTPLRLELGRVDTGEFGYSLDFTGGNALLVGDPGLSCEGACLPGGILRFCGPLDDMRLVEAIRIPAVLGVVGQSMASGDGWIAAGSSGDAGSTISAGNVGVLDTTSVPTCERSFIGEIYCEGSSLNCPLGAGQDGAGCPNSVSDGAILRVRGLPTMDPESAKAFVTGVPPGAVFILAVGNTFSAHSFPAAVGLGDGYLCIGSVHSRLAPRLASPDGTVHFKDVFQAGYPFWPRIHYFAIQGWYRDPSSPGFGSNLTNAVMLRLRN